MLSKYFLAIGIIFLTASIIVIPYGVYLQTLSPIFPEYESYVVKRMAAEGVDGPGAFVGLMLSSFWPFVAVSSIAIGLGFVCGAFILLWLAGLNRDLALVACGVFLSGCFVLAFSQLREGLLCARWGFIVLGIGNLLMSAGLALGSFGVVGCCRNRRSHRLPRHLSPSLDNRTRL